jgi:hypothetical protein
MERVAGAEHSEIPRATRPAVFLGMDMGPSDEIARGGVIFG